MRRPRLAIAVHCANACDVSRGVRDLCGDCCSRSGWCPIGGAGSLGSGHCGDRSAAGHAYPLGKCQKPQPASAPRQHHRRPISRPDNHSRALQAPSAECRGDQGWDVPVQLDAPPAAGAHLLVLEGPQRRDDSDVLADQGHHPRDHQQLSEPDQGRLYRHRMVTSAVARQDRHAASPPHAPGRGTRIDDTSSLRSHLASPTAWTTAGRGRTTS